VGTGFLALIGLTSVEQLEIQASNKLSSAGFGPNQMSSMLGLGALMAILHAIFFSDTRKIRWFMVLIGVWLTVQSVLTFSRGGFWNFLVALSVACAFLYKKKKYSKVIIAGGLAFFLTATFVIIPRLDEYTGGAFTKRFESLDTTGRKEITQADFRIFLQNPVFGAGPGQSVRLHRMVLGAAKAAHTEYSRLLAEHGIFGVAAIGILFVLFLQRYRYKAPTEYKALMMAFTIWALFYMLHAAMRLAAPAFLFALAAIKFDDKRKDILKMFLGYESIVRN
jgi:hypothetical protein